MRFSDTMLGAVLLVLGLVIGANAQTFPYIPGQRYGAAAFPTIIAAGFVGCALILIARGLRAVGTPLVTRTEWTRKPGALLAVAVTILCVVAYVALARPMGFILTSIAILFLLFRMLRVSWGRTILFAVATALITDYVFRSILLVPLPFGVMPRLPW